MDDVAAVGVEVVVRIVAGGVGDEVAIGVGRYSALMMWRPAALARA
jgi:hypothetical protein